MSEAEPSPDLGSEPRSRHRSIIAAVLLGLVLVGIVVAVVARRDPNVIPAPVPPPAPSPTAGQQPESLLIQIRDDSLNAGQAAIVGVRWLPAAGAGTGTPASSGAASPAGARTQSSTMTLPSVTTLDVAAAGPITVGGSGVLSQGDAVQLTSAQTGVRIDGALTLDRLAFAGLIDNAGPLTIQVPRNTTIPNTDPNAPGAVSRILLAGTHVMDGQTAAAYALADIPGEPVADRGGRFLAVWSETLRALPAEPERIRQVLTSLGALARSNVSADEVAIVLAGERSSIIDGTARTASLPVRRYGLRAARQARSAPIPGVRPVTLRGWRIDQPTADPLLTELFADLLLPVATDLTGPTASPTPSTSGSPGASGGTAGPNSDGGSGSQGATPGASATAASPTPSPVPSSLIGPRIALMGSGATLAIVDDAKSALRDAGAVPVWRGWQAAPVRPPSLDSLTASPGPATSKRPPSVVYVRSDAKALGLQVAAALGIAPTQVKVDLGPAAEATGEAAPLVWVLLGSPTVGVESSNP